jgi:hypothetical protein
LYTCICATSEEPQPLEKSRRGAFAHRLWRIFAGEVSGDFKPAEPFKFLPTVPPKN